MTVAISNPGISIDYVDVGSAAWVFVGLRIASNASPGPANVTLTTVAGTSPPLVFTVNTPPPTLASVTPAVGAQGTSVPVTLTGTNFFAGATVASSNPGIAVGSVVVVSETQISATFTVSPDAASGNANITVTTAGGTSGAATFAVNLAVPTLSSVSPSSGAQGASVPVTLAGTNFISGATVATSNPGITVGNVTLVSATQITATFTIAANAATGGVDVTVTTAGGTSAPAAFTVNAVAPTITSLWPTSGPPGTAVIIIGAQFGSSQGASTVTFNGVNAGAAGNWSDTSITVTVPSSASTGNLVVTVGGLASNGVLFTAGTPPSITLLWPRSGPVGTPVTITGVNFGATQGPSTVTFGGIAAGPAAYWSATSITVTVPSGAATGSVVVTVNGLASNGTPYAVTNPPTLSGVTLSEAKPGDTVTVTGTGFGPAQGIGQVWLGSTYGTVVSWTDTQVTATVALNSRTGKAQVLQSGVWSNSLPFTVDTVTITEVLPSSGFPGDVVTINGSGFGNTQGSGSIQLGSSNGVVVSWSDTQIVARVAASAVSGIARVQQGGISSNAMTFTVLGGGSTAVTMAPNLLNLMVGDTRTLQALDATGHAVTGLAWTTSDGTVASLSSTDPQVLTALAPGHVTITAGSASADVTVWADAMPQGTVLWSNPGNGSGVTKIVPAVPSPTGVADVFAFQGDGTVQAITSDGTTAWTADVSGADKVIPDFQGGLVMSKYDGDTYTWSITKLDGMTGTARTLYQTTDGWGDFVVHPDGTIFLTARTGRNKDRTDAYEQQVIGVDPTTGSPKFGVSIYSSEFEESQQLIIAGDGYAYLSHADPDPLNDPGAPYRHLKVLRVATDGTYDDIEIKASWIPVEIYIKFNTITNADQGIVVSWSTCESSGPNVSCNDTNGLAVVTGTTVSLVNAPEVPGQSENVVPVLQAQDGSFVGTAWVALSSWPWSQPAIVAFDPSGNVRWSVPGYEP
ncbi:MAG TPA: IPT/TIG domain-containing protein, partial [Candidatus Solibacter sp.]